MNRLLMLPMAAFIALLMTGCGEEWNTPRMPDSATDQSTAPPAEQPSPPPG